MSRTGLTWGHPTPGSHKGWDTSCISLCRAVFGLIQSREGEEEDIGLLVTAQNPLGEREVSFSSLLSALIIS